MGNSVIVEKFKELGLSSYEARSYLSLLEKDTLSVSEVARLAGIPRANAYEALEKLLAKGFCISRPGKIRQYSALDPSILEEKAILLFDNHFEGELNKLYEKQDQVLTEKKAARKRLADLTEELTPLYRNSRSNGNPLEYIEIIKDPYLIHKRFMALVDEVKEEILVFSKPPFSGPRQKLKEQYNQQAELLQRGIRIRNIYEIIGEKDEIEWWYDSIDTAAKLGEEARVSKDLPIKMAIFDERIILLPLIDPVSSGISFTSQVVEHASLARGLKILFDTLWERAEDYHVLEDLLKAM